MAEDLEVLVPVDVFVRKREPWKNIKSLVVMKTSSFYAFRMFIEECR